MAGTEFVFDVVVIFGTRVGVLDHEADRRAGRLAFEDAGQDFDLIAFLPLRREFRLAGTAAVEPGLDVGLIQIDARRTAIDHDADRGAMALTPSRETKKSAEAVAGHN